MAGHTHTHTRGTSINIIRLTNSIRSYPVRYRYLKNNVFFYSTRKHRHFVVSILYNELDEIRNTEYGHGSKMSLRTRGSCSDCRDRYETLNTSYETLCETNCFFFFLVFHQIHIHASYICTNAL